MDDALIVDSRGRFVEFGYSLADPAHQLCDIELRQAAAFVEQVGESLTGQVLHDHKGAPVIRLTCGKDCYHMLTFHPGERFDLSGKALFKYLDGKLQIRNVLIFRQVNLSHASLAQLFPDDVATA